MTHDEAFLQDIVAHLDDDTPRLIYADWLDDRNNPRGEFIRLQVELAHFPEADPRHARLERRCGQLLEQHEQAWLNPLAEVLPAEDYHFIWKRGFVAELIGWGQQAGQQLALHVAEVFELAPLEAIRLLPTGGLGRSQFPWEKGKLHTDRLRLDDLNLLLHAPEMIQIKLLDLGGDILQDPSDQDLSDDREIVISHQLGDSGARLLAGAAHLGGLRELLLADNVIGDAGARALAESPHLAQLERLDLSHNSIGEEMKRTLLQRLGERVLV